MYILTFYVLTKNFLEKSTFFVSSVKKKKIGVKKVVYMAFFLSFLHMPQKTPQIFMKLGVHT
jgi:hypothetical protein